MSVRLLVSYTAAVLIQTCHAGHSVMDAFSAVFDRHYFNDIKVEPKSTASNKNDIQRGV